MIILIDNYDSFTWNLVHYIGELGAKVEVHRNDKITVSEVMAARPDGIVLSPGPCTPNEAGICLELVEKAGPHIPLFGVCLGHQTIGQVFGGTVVRAPEIMHGKTSLVRHHGVGVFTGLPQPLEATRYHSLVVDRASVPDVLEITAETDDGIVMGLRHREHPTEGVQFHPESILTVGGHDLVANFLEQVDRYR